MSSAAAAPRGLRASGCCHSKNFLLQLAACLVIREPAVVLRAATSESASTTRSSGSWGPRTDACRSRIMHITPDYNLEVSTMVSTRLSAAVLHAGQQSLLGDLDQVGMCCRVGTRWMLDDGENVFLDVGEAGVCLHGWQQPSAAPSMNSRCSRRELCRHALSSPTSRGERLVSSWCCSDTSRGTPRPLQPPPAGASNARVARRGG